MTDLFALLPLVLPNFLILLGLSAILLFSVRHLIDRPRWQFDSATGLLFGLTAMALMSQTVPILKGAFADLRHVVILCAGLLAGPVAGALATLLTALYRLSLGGNLIGPLTTLLIAGLLGGLYHWRRPFPACPLPLRHLLVLALSLAVINAAMPWLGWLLGDPIDAQEALYLSQAILGSALFLYPLGTWLLVTLLVQEYQRIYNERILAQEIAERRRAEAALKKQHGLVQALLDHSPDAIFVHDTAGHLLLSNAADTRNRGHHLEGVTGRHLTEVFPPDLAHRFLQEDQQVKARQAAMAFENTVEVSGEVRHYAVVKAPYRDEQGQVAGVLGIARDVTEQKRAEAVLRENEERYRTLMEAALAGIYVIQEDTFAYVNPTMARLFGYTPAQMVGHLNPLDLIFAPQQRHQARVRLTERLQGIPVSIPLELTGVRRDGTTFEALTLSRRVIYRGRPALVGSLMDISDRKRMETALRDSEERFRQLVENLDSVFWMSSLGGDRILYVSPAYEKLSGRTCRFLYDNPHGWVEAIDPEDAPGVQDIHQRILNESPIQLTYRIHRPDGQVRWVCSHAFAVRNRAGEVYRLAGIIQDITDYKALEEQRQQQQNQLTHAARLSLTGEMASGLAHELNQPLAAISIYTELLQALLEQDPVVVDRLRQITAEITAQTQRAGGIIRWMKDFTRRTRPRFVLVDLNALIDESVYLISHEIRRDLPIGLRRDLDEDLPLVQADALQVQQVLLNVLWNGVEALREAGIVDGELTLRTRLWDDNRVMVEVSDNGPGLPADAMAHLFEPFFTTKAQGTGLGLSISYSIIEAHEGTLEALPNSERGITFRFTLPILRAQGKASGVFKKS